MEQSPSACTSLTVRGLTGLLRLYQGVSRLGGRHCRFHPTCSEYLRESLNAFGFWRGMRLGLFRLLRCHPWNPGGVDLVRMPYGK